MKSFGKRGDPKYSSERRSGGRQNVRPGNVERNVDNEREKKFVVRRGPETGTMRNKVDKTPKLKMEIRLSRCKYRSRVKGRDSRSGLFILPVWVG